MSQSPEGAGADSDEENIMKQGTHTSMSQSPKGSVADSDMEVSDGINL